MVIRRLLNRIYNTYRNKIRTYILYIVNKLIFFLLYKCTNDFHQKKYVRNVGLYTYLEWKCGTGGKNEEKLLAIKWKDFAAVFSDTIIRKVEQTIE